MILKLLFFQVAILPVVKPEPICELSDCSLPKTIPAHENCTEEHFVRLNLMRSAQISSIAKGSLLEVIDSIPDSDCITVTSQFSVPKDPARERKFQLGAICHNKQVFVYEKHLEVVRDGRGRLKCFKSFFNFTEQCTAMRNDHLRIRAEGRGLEVTNFDEKGDQIIGRIVFLERNHSVDLNQPCDCKEFGRLADQYLNCKDNTENSLMRIVAYGIAAGFVTILAVSVIYSLLVMD